MAQRPQNKRKRAGRDAQLHIITNYTLHFHCLVGIDHDADVPESVVIERVRGRYGDDRAKSLLHEVETAREQDDEEAAQRALDRYRRRMNNLAEFAKDVLQRFTMSYNRRHGCIGRFWSDRYKSSVDRKSVV